MAIKISEAAPLSFDRLPLDETRALFFLAFGGQAVCVIWGGRLVRFCYLKNGPVAQWLEQSAHNRLVAGSIPAGPTKKLESWRTRKLGDGFLYKEWHPWLSICTNWGIGAAG